MDALHCRILSRSIFGVDAHTTVIIDIHFSTGFFNDGTNRRTALTDDVADFVWMNIQSHHCWRVIRKFFAGFAQYLVHFTKNMNSGFIGLTKRRFHNLFGDAFDLDVHLQRCNTFVGTRNLEVHITEVVFVTQDVRQYGITVTFLHQAHCNTGNRSSHRHTSVHKRQ